VRTPWIPRISFASLAEVLWSTPVRAELVAGQMGHLCAVEEEVLLAHDVDGRSSPYTQVATGQRGGVLARQPGPRRRHNSAYSSSSFSAPNPSIRAKISSISLRRDFGMRSPVPGPACDDGSPLYGEGSASHEFAGGINRR